jgi:hypothetical protein
MRFSRVIRERVIAYAKVTTVLGSIPASSDTGAADEAVLNKVQQKSKKFPC